MKSPHHHIQAMIAAAALTLLTAFCGGWIADAGGMDLSWNTIDCGGATYSSGDDLELGGTIGQHDAGLEMIGGDFQLTGGFWAGIRPLPDCLGDVNHDGLVNIDDLVNVITNWGAAGGIADVNHDLTVNIDDLVIVIVHWGACPL